jgi:hypothetical protein
MSIRSITDSNCDLPQVVVDERSWCRTGYAHKHQVLANRALGLNINAALALGDFPGTDIEWVTGLLGNYRLPIEALCDYLHTCQRATMEQLDERGQPIINRLGQLVNGYATN